MNIIKGIEKAKGQYLIYADDGEYICSTLDGGIAKEIKRALETQAPLKPQTIVSNQNIRIGNAVFKKGTTIYKCKRCHVFISKTIRYCPHCGQRIASEKEVIR